MYISAQSANTGEQLFHHDQFDVLSIISAQSANCIAIGWKLKYCLSHPAQAHTIISAQEAK